MLAGDVRDGGITILDADGLEGPLAFGGERLDDEPVDRCADEDLASDGWHCARGARVVSTAGYMHGRVSECRRRD